jgi:16S rRNA (guanine527-N7)-methyltransferase
MPLDHATAGLTERLEHATLQLQLHVDAANLERLLAYLRLIERWNRVYNLTALKTSEEMFTHHLMDCLAIVPAVTRWSNALTTPPEVLDVGSGAGLPGVVLAILWPEWRVTCIDAVAKKATFIRQVGAELALPNLEAVHGRVESPMTWGARRFDLILSRAFASLADFVQLTRSTLAPQAVWAAMKAQLTEAEVPAVPDDIDVFHVEHLTVPGLDAQRCLVWMRPRAAGSLIPAEH